MTDDHEAMRHFDLLAVVREVVEEFPEQVDGYRKGRPYLGFLLGQAMKRLQGVPDDRPLVDRAREVQDAIVEVVKEQA